jgi:hypothetical protein
MDDHTDDLPPLDPELRALVSAYESATARDGAQVDAALAHVTAKAGTAGGGDTAAMSTTVKIGLVTALVGVIGVVGIVGLRPSNEPASVRPATQTASAATESPPVRVAEEAPRAVIVESASAVEPEGSPVEHPRERATIGEGRTKPRASVPETRAATPVEEADSLKAELELLRQARSALRSGRAQQALEIVQRHRREYSASRVADERDATELSALCALGRHDDARATATAMARRSSRSAEDLLRGCP